MSQVDYFDVENLGAVLETTIHLGDIALGLIPSGHDLKDIPASATLINFRQIEALIIAMNQRNGELSEKIKEMVEIMMNQEPREAGKVPV